MMIKITNGRWINSDKVLSVERQDAHSTVINLEGDVQLLTSLSVASVVGRLNGLRVYDDEEAS